MTYSLEGDNFEYLSLIHISQISHKTYYKPEDVMAIVAVVEDKKKDMRDVYKRQDDDNG